jgi:hypothetical protein
MAEVVAVHNLPPDGLYVYLSSHELAARRSCKREHRYESLTPFNGSTPCDIALADGSF